MSDADRLEALIAVAHATAMLAALEQRLLAPLAVQVLRSDVAGGALDRELDKHWIREELACALNWSGAAVEGRLHVAQTLVERLPSTLACLESGRLDYARARGIADAAGGLEDATWE